VPRSQAIRAQRLGVLPKISEFHESVAKDVGVGGQSCSVLLDERGEHRVPVLFDEIDPYELDANCFGDR